MSEVISANILGINANNNGGISAGKKSGSNEGQAFVKEITSAMSSDVAGAASIVTSMSNSMQDTLKEISFSYDLDKRQTLATEFRDTVVSALQGAGYNASAGTSPDKIVMDGKTYDILNSLNSPGAEVSTQFILTGDSTSSGTTSPSGPAKEVLFETGRKNSELVSKINNATTLDERMDYVFQLRDVMLDALNAAGHSAYEYGKADKIVVNGNLIDIFKASNGVGMNTEVQWLDHGPAINHGIGPGSSGGSSGGGDFTSAIFAAGAEGASTLSQISNSVNLEERRELAVDFQNMMVSALKAQGFNAEVHTDPDKISINGVTFDVIRSLNTPGAHASLQALRVV